MMMADDYNRCSFCFCYCSILLTGGTWTLEKMLDKSREEMDPEVKLILRRLQFTTLFYSSILSVIIVYVLCKLIIHLINRLKILNGFLCFKSDTPTFTFRPGEQVWHKSPCHHCVWDAVTKPTHSCSVVGYLQNSNLSQRCRELDL